MREPKRDVPSENVQLYGSPQKSNLSSTDTKQYLVGVDCMEGSNHHQGGDVLKPAEEQSAMTGIQGLVVSPITKAQMKTIQPVENQRTTENKNTKPKTQIQPLILQL